MNQIMGLTGIAFILFSITMIAVCVAKENKAKAKESKKENKALQDAVQAYSEEMRKNEEDIKKINEGGEAGFDASVDLMRKLNESGRKRNS